MYDKKILCGLFSGALFFIFCLPMVSARSNDGKGTYIDTHMHLSPGYQAGEKKKGPQMKSSRMEREAMRSRRQEQRHLIRTPRDFGSPQAPPARRDPTPFADISQNPPASDSPPDDLIRLMDRYGVQKSLIVVVPSHRLSEEEDYHNALRAISKHPDRLFLMAGGAQLGALIQKTPVDQVTDDIKKKFADLAQKILADGAVGFGEMIALHLCMSRSHSYQYAPPDHPLLLLLADIAAENNVPLDLHCEAVPEAMPTPEGLRQSCNKNPAVMPATIPALERLLRHNPKAKIVWQHIGWDNTGYQSMDLLRRVLQNYPNLYLALRVEERAFQVGTHAPMPNRIVDENLKIKPQWLAFMEEFSDRLMIGGDEFIGGIGGQKESPQSFEETWSILDQLPPELSKKIGHDNAAAVYRMRGGVPVE